MKTAILSGVLAALALTVSVTAQVPVEDDAVIREYRRTIESLGLKTRNEQDPEWVRASRQWPEIDKVVKTAIDEQDAALNGRADGIAKCRTLYQSRIQQGRAVDHYLYGRILGLTEDLEGAYQQFRAALDIDRYFFWAWDGLGVYHSNKRNWDAAIENFEAALRINPGFDKAAFGVAQARIQKGDFTGAALRLNELLTKRADPDPASLRQARLLLAEVYRNQDDLVRCLDELAALEKEGFQDFRLHAMRAFCCKRLERWSEAAKEYERIIQDDPKEDRFYEAMAECYVRLGRNADAANALDKALRNNSEAYTAENRNKIESEIERLRKRPAVEEVQNRALSLDEWINRLLHSTEVDKRREAVFFLSRAPLDIDNESVARKLMKAFANAVRDADFIVRAKSLDQLAVRYGDLPGLKERVRPLIELFVDNQHERDARVRGLAAHHLAMWDAKLVVPVLILAAQDEQDPEVFREIHESLNSLTLAWIERIQDRPFEPQDIVRLRNAWNGWYRKHRDVYRKNEPKRFEEVWKN